MPRLIDFTIGADPEFVCMGRRNKELSDKYLIYNSNLDDVPDDECCMFGTDHGGSVREVRPPPSKDPLEVVSNIHDIFKKIISRSSFEKSTWHAGSFKNNHALGGHIHFGIFKDRNDMELVAKILDNYLGPITLLIEDHKEGLKRRKAMYGHFGQHRAQPYGFEYRTPSSWLTCPYVATSILCTAKTVVYEYVNNKRASLQIDRFSNWEFANMRLGPIRNYFPKIWHEITLMKLYPTYKIYIDLLYWLVKNKFNWYPQSGMKEAWGLFNPHKTTLGTIWQKHKLIQRATNVSQI